MTDTAFEPSQTVILCVEDEDDLRRDIADELIEAGYEVIEACNGAETLELLSTTRPDLILCDISMPGPNGYAVLRAVQAIGADYADIAFVFLSALGDPREIVEGKRLGADDYLVKPIDYDLLLATVHARLRQIARIRAAHPAEPAGPDDETLIAAFGLTPAEARIGVALTEGRPLSQISVDFRISRTTVAFHMRNIFAKTGTSRQAGLVALLLKKQTKLPPGFRSK